MADEVAATPMVAYFANGTAQLRGRSVYVQFSNHKELKTDQTHSNAVSGAPLTPAAAAAGPWHRLPAAGMMPAHLLVPVGSSSGGSRLVMVVDWAGERLAG